MRRLITTSIFALFSIALCQGQNWIKTYCDTGGYGGVFAVETYDHGFLIGGSSTGKNENSVLYKTDVNGNVLWQRNIGVSDGNTTIKAICTSPDGSCAIVGQISKSDSPDEVFLLKINACGEIDWVKKYRAFGSLITHNVYRMKDGGYVFNLEINNFGWIYRTNKNGDLIWSSLQDPVPVNISTDDSDNVFITGYNYYTTKTGTGATVPNTEVYVAKLDSNGNKLMEGSHWDYRNAGEQTLPAPGGNCLTLGFDLSDSNNFYNLYLFLWNYKGELLRDIYIKNTLGDISPSDIVRTGDSSYILLAYHWSGSGQMHALKIVSDTVVVKDTSYNYGFGMSPSTISATSDGKYIISGSVEKSSNPAGIYAAKINSALMPDSFYSTKYNYDYKCAMGTLPSISQIMIDSGPVIYNDIEEIPLTGNVSVFPNPAKDFININCSGLNNGEIQFSMYNILGDKILSSEFRSDEAGNLSQQINLENIPGGCYIVELRQGNILWRQKLMVR